MSECEREALFHYMATNVDSRKCGKPYEKYGNVAWAEYAADVPGTAFPEDPRPGEPFH